MEPELHYNTAAVMIVRLVQFICLMTPVGADASIKQSKRFNSLLFRQPKHVESSLS